MASISAADLNYFIFRYLKESGFSHSAFTFGFEAGIDKSPIDGSSVPPQTLVKIVQKGVEYIRLEAKEIKENTNLEEEFFCFLTPTELLTKDVPEMQKIVADRKKNQPLVAPFDLNSRTEGPSSSNVKDKERKEIQGPSSYDVKDKERKDQENPDVQGFLRFAKGSQRKGKQPEFYDNYRYTDKLGLIKD